MNESMKKSVDALKEISAKISTDPVYAQALEDEFKKSLAPRGAGAALKAPGAPAPGAAKPAGVKPPTAPKMPKMAMPKMSMKAEPAAAAKPDLKAMMAKTDECVAKLGKAVGGDPKKAHVAAKGVHKPVLSPNSGKSAMGIVSNPAQKKALATQVVKEQAVMKKPNLPKAEPGAAPAAAAAPAPAMRAPVKPPLRQLLKESDGWMKKCGMMKADNPDEKEDAKLGETVENVVENHMLANKEAEKQEGHKILKDK